MGCGGSKQTVAGVGSSPAAKHEVQTHEEPLEADFKVTLTRASPEQSLGLEKTAKENRCWYVERCLADGLVPEWNQKMENEPEVQVKSGHIIVDVNGVKGDIEAMEKEILKESVTLGVMRGSLAQDAPPAVSLDGHPPSVAEPAAEPGVEPVVQPGPGESEPAVPAPENEVEAQTLVPKEPEPLLADPKKNENRDGDMVEVANEEEDNKVQDKHCIFCSSGA